MNGFITCEGNGRAMTDAYTKETVINDVGADIFTRGLCLPSDVKMSKEQQEKVISIVRSCFE